MATENLEERETRRFPGFQRFADDDDRFVDDWDEGPEAYGAPGGEEPGAVGRRGRRAALLVGGLLCVALAAGAAISWPGLSARWARRDIPPPAPAPAAQRPGLTVQLAQGGAGEPAAPPLEPANAIPVPPPVAAGPERAGRSPPESVDRAMGPAAPVAAPQTSAPSPPVLARGEPPPAELAPAPPPRADPEAAPAIRQPAAVPVPGALDCGNVASRAQALACGDPGLRAADRRMSQAYAAALAAGVPERQLRRDQVDWLNMREDAARYSKQALENMYHQRIQELEALGDAPPP
jgi:uncharacterized protein YecT (DUF1311 family)